WERGDALPESKAIILEVARKLALETFEARQFLEASLAFPAPYWVVPFRRNPLFIGRTSTLQVLHRYLTVKQPAALTQAIAVSGMGGIGKTQVALEYAYLYALEYGAVFWLAAETPESLLTSLQHIASHLQLPEHQAVEQRQVVDAVRHWLSTH